MYQLSEIDNVIVLIFHMLRDIKCNPPPPQNYTGSKWKNSNAKIRFVLENTEVNKLPPEVSVVRTVVINFLTQSEFDLFQVYLGIKLKYIQVL